MLRSEGTEWRGVGSASECGLTFGRQLGAEQSQPLQGPVADESVLQLVDRLVRQPVVAEVECLQATSVNLK